MAVRLQTTEGKNQARTARLISIACPYWWSRCPPCINSTPTPACHMLQTALAQQIEAIDRQIDAQVNELYGLTEEEIGIVEGGGMKIKRHGHLEQSIKRMSLNRMRRILWKSGLFQFWR